MSIITSAITSPTAVPSVLHTNRKSTIHSGSDTTVSANRITAAAE